MEQNTIRKLRNDLTVSNSVTRKWIKINDLSNGQCSFNKNISFKTPVFRSDCVVMAMCILL